MKNIKEYNLRDIILEILFSWKKIFIVLIVAIVLCSGMNYIKSANDIKQNIQNNAENQRKELENKSQEEIEEIYKSELSTIQINNVVDAYMYEQQYNQKKQYIEKNTMLKADPFHIAMSDLIFVVSADKSDRAYEIRDIYAKLLSGTEFIDILVDENIATSCDQFIQILDDNDNRIMGSNILHIRVRYINIEGCQKIVELLTDYIREQQEEMKEIEGEYTLNLISSSYAEIADTDLMNRKETLQKELLALESQIQELEKNFSEEQREYFLFLKGELENQSALLDSIPVEEKASVSVREVALEVILIVLLYLCFLCVKGIEDKKLKPKSNFCEKYSISQLGLIIMTDRRKTLGSFIDNKIKRVYFDRKYIPSEEETIDIVCAEIELQAEKADINEIYFVGSSMTDTTKRLCKQIEEKLNKREIMIKVFDDVLYKANSIRDLKYSKGIVLMETAKSTLYSEIENEIMLIDRQNVPILGAIIVAE